MDKSPEATGARIANRIADAIAEPARDQTQVINSIKLAITANSRCQTFRTYRLPGIRQGMLATARERGLVFTPEIIQKYNLGPLFPEEI